MIRSARVEPVSATLTGVIPRQTHRPHHRGQPRPGKHAGPWPTAIRRATSSSPTAAEAAEAEAVVTRAHALGVRAHALALDVGETPPSRPLPRGGCSCSPEWQHAFQLPGQQRRISIRASFGQTTEQQFDTPAQHHHLKGTF